MLTKLVVLAALVGVSVACDQAWPNGTDTKLNWFPSCNGPVTFFSLAAQDTKGNAEYPISLTAPLIIKADINNPKNTYTAGNLFQTLNLWSWGGWAGCSWSAVPTMGLLKDLDACTNGVPCPVKPGRQILPVTMDFSGFDSIIKLLKNDAPYQLEMILNDKPSGDTSCVTVQARALTK